MMTTAMNVDRVIRIMFIQKYAPDRQLSQSVLGILIILVTHFSLNVFVAVEGNMSRDGIKQQKDDGFCLGWWDVLTALTR